MRIAIAVASAGLLISSSAMAAQQPIPCGKFTVVARNLAQSFHEYPVARAISGEGRMLMVVFASKGGETWTAVGVGSDRVACIFGAGTDWQYNLSAADGPLAMMEH